MKKIKGILGILLSTLVLLSSFPVSVFAVTPEAPTLDNVNIKIQAYDDDKDRNIQSITVSASTFKNKFSDTIVFGSPTESDGQWFCTATLTGYSSTGTEDTHVVNYLIRGTSYNGYTISADETAVKDIQLVYDENKSEWNVAGSDDNTVIYRVSKNGTACIHSLIKIDGKEPTCEENGFEAYWKCENCGKLFSDGNGKNEISAPIEIPASGHSLIKVEGKEATCEENGFEAYWQCENCGKLFSDENGENEIAFPITIPAKGHSYDNGFCTECGAIDSRYKLGDVNLDGYVNIIDATLVQKYLAQISFSDTFSKPHADANNDGIINISDATLIQFIAAEIIDS